MAADKDDLIRVSEEPHTLKRDMTEAEKQFDQEQLLQVLQRIEDLATEKKSVMSEIAARDKKYIETYKDIKQRLQSGKIMQSVMCELTLNFTTGVATVCNKETGEVVQTRPMTQDERTSDATPELPFDEDTVSDDTVIEGERSDPTTQADGKATSALLAAAIMTSEDFAPDAESGQSDAAPMTKDEVNAHEIGRASCRERV